MAHTQVRPTRKRQEWVNRFAVEKLRGAPLFMSGSIATQYNATVQATINRMVREVTHDVLRLGQAFAGDGDEWAVAMLSLIHI